MTHAGLVVTHLLVSVFLGPHSVEKKTPHVVHTERLIQSVSDDTHEAWFEFLLAEGVEFSVRGGADFYVAADPVGVLRRAEKIEVFRSEARRALTERILERRVSETWPRVESVAVCVAFEETPNETGAPAVFILAPNFPAEDKPSLDRIVLERVPGAEPDRIRVLGSVVSAPDRNPSLAIAQR